MVSFGNGRTYLILGIWLNFVIWSYGTEFYVTGIKCQNLDESFIKMNSCFTKISSRTVSETTFNITLLEEVKTAAIKFEFVKKSNNGYNNYMFKNILVNACTFMEKRVASPLVNYLYTIVEGFTNFNHTCPYKDSIIMDRFRIDMDKLKWLPMPPGDYGVISHWYAQGKERLMISVYYTFSE